MESKISLPFTFVGRGSGRLLRVIGDALEMADL